MKALNENARLWTMKAAALALVTTTTFGAGAAHAASPELAPKGTEIAVTGEAGVTLPNDEAEIVFALEKRGDSGEAVAKALAADGAKGREALKPLLGKDVTVRTTDLRTWPVYKEAKPGEAPEIAGWAGRETLAVTVKRTEALDAVMKALTPVMTYDGLTFKLSDKARAKARNALIDKAVADGLKQAHAAALGLGHAQSRVTVDKMQVGDVSTPSSRYYPAARALGSDANLKSAAVPAVSAGESRVTLRVLMQVRLQDAK